MESKDNKKKSRREFLIASTAIAGGLVSLSLLKGFDVFGKTSSKTTTAEKGKHWYGFGFDIDKCIGCGNCAKSCKTENDVPPEPFFFRTWVEQYTIKNDGTVKVEAPNGGIDGFRQTVPEEDIFKAFFVPKACNQCAKSPCVQVCPVGATFVSTEGIVLVDEKYCIGCGYCVQACPYGTRYIHPQKHVADKCTLCIHRITKGLSPACVENCPTGARMYGDLNDKKGPLVQFIKDHPTRVLKPHLNTGSKLYYNALREEVR
jgi:tetrathionate reductase subunit B